MKALSIIGLILSVISILVSIAICNISCYNSFGLGQGGYSNNVGGGPGMISLILSLYFLAFSIVATVRSFKKKNNNVSAE